MASEAQEMIDIPVVLSKKVDNVIYNLMVRTITDQVFEGKHSLTEVLMTIRKSIDGKASDEEFHELTHKLEEFFNCSEEDVRTLSDIHYYIQSFKDSDDILMEILTKKVDESLFTTETQAIKQSIEDLKIAFATTLTTKYVSKDELRAAGYATSTELQESEERMTQKIKDMEESIRDTMRNIIVSSEGMQAPSGLIDGGFWVQITE